MKMKTSDERDEDQRIEIAQLKAENQHLKAELEAMTSLKCALQEALEACEKASGFVPKDTPLPVWIARLAERAHELNHRNLQLDSARNELHLVKEQLDAANKACAELRQHLATLSVTHPHLVPPNLLSSDCGKGYVSVESVKPLVEAIRLFVEWCKTPEQVVTPEVIEAQHDALELANKMGL